MVTARLAAAEVHVFAWRSHGLLGLRQLLDQELVIGVLPKAAHHGGGFEGFAQLRQLAGPGLQAGVVPLQGLRIPAELLHQSGALGIKPPQKPAIPHLRLQEHHRQLRFACERLKQPIQAVFPFLHHRRRLPPATGLRWQIALQLQEAIGMVQKQPIEEFVLAPMGE
jgi:hypothetical protein